MSIITSSLTEIGELLVWRIKFQLKTIILDIVFYRKSKYEHTLIMTQFNFKTLL